MLSVAVKPETDTVRDEEVEGTVMPVTVGGVESTAGITFDC